MDSKTRCNSFKLLIIPHKSYYGDLSIEIIISDLDYLKSESKVGYGTYPLYKNLKNVINKLKDEKYFCNYYKCDYVSLDEKYFCKYYKCGYVSLDEKEVAYMFLVILDYILKKVSSDSYFTKLKEEIEKKLNVRIYYPSMKKTVKNSS